MDRLTPEKRSWNMSRIRGKDTKPEILVRSILHRNGFRFRLKSKVLPGKPDIILPRYKTAIFVHGCFWHRHKGCRYAYTPKTRLDFWSAKFKANVKRDKVVFTEVRKLGWKYLAIWECETRNETDLKKRIKALLGKL